MLKQSRIWPQIQGRILAGPLAAYVDAYVSALVREGYSELGIRRQIRGIDVFGAWLSRRAIAGEAVDRATVERFVNGVGRTPSLRSAQGRLREVASCARRFARFLWTQGVAERGEEPTDTEDAGGVLQSFDDHLRQVKGLAPGTRKIYLRYARLFALQRSGAGEHEWSAVRPDDVVSFVRFQASRPPGEVRTGPEAWVIPRNLVQVLPDRRWSGNHLFAGLEIGLTAWGRSPISNVEVELKGVANGKVEALWLTPGKAEKVVVSVRLDRLQRLLEAGGVSSKIRWEGTRWPVL